MLREASQRINFLNCLVKQTGCPNHPQGIIFRSAVYEAFDEEDNALMRDNPPNTWDLFPNAVQKLLERPIPS